MKTKSIKTILILIPLSLFSCMEIIDKPDISRVGDDVWQDYTMAQMYLDYLYNNSMPAAAWGGNMNSTDEAYGNSATDVLYGSVIVGSESSFSKDFWSRIRVINTMLDEMAISSTLSQNEQNLLLGQARFLRAIEYWQIVRLYGGIPILPHSLDIQKSNGDFPRSTTKECIQFILNDLDTAALFLPADWRTGDPSMTNFGRLTSGAAKAFKGRVLLHFASPMFTQRNAYTSYDGTAVPAFTLSDSIKNARWEAAYQANKVAYDSLTAQGFGLVADRKLLFTTEGNVNPEAIMVRIYTGLNYTHNWEYRIRPGSLSGNGALINPTWEMALAFPTAEGKRTWETGSGYQDKFYWVNRDPRFYETLVYNGANWDMGGSSGRKQWCYTGTNSEQNVAFSGFYCRKGQDASLSVGNISNGKTDWMEIRFAEVMLNLAESALETSDLHPERMAEAVELIRQIRKRAGILQGTDPNTEYGVSNALTKIDMLDLIMNERFVEFAFENKRYWDLRRRMMYTNDLSSKTLKLNGTRRRRLDNSPKSAQKVFLDTNKDNLVLTEDNYYTYFLSFYLTKIDTNPNVPSLGINYKDDYNFFPIPDDMFSNSTLLEQTMGWAGGTFDPLAE